MIKQKNKNDCFLACLAMASGKTYEECFTTEITEAIENAKGVRPDTVDKMFELAGFIKNVDYTTIYTFNKDIYLIRDFLIRRKAILQVPSLNFENTEHGVYWDGNKILDPSNLQVYNYLSQCFPTYVYLFNSAVLNV